MQEFFSLGFCHSFPILRHSVSPLPPPPPSFPLCKHVLCWGFFFFKASTWKSTIFPPNFISLWHHGGSLKFLIHLFLACYVSSLRAGALSILYFAVFPSPRIIPDLIAGAVWISIVWKCEWIHIFNSPSYDSVFNLISWRFYLNYLFITRFI